MAIRGVGIDLEEAKFLYFEKDYSFEKVGKILRCSGRTISNMFREAGLESLSCNRPRVRKNLKGKRIGGLFVVESAGQGDDGRCRLWKCICDCGNEAVLKTDYLTGSGQHKTCGCRVKWFGPLSSSVWSAMSWSIRDRGIPLDLSAKQASLLFVKQGGACKLSGLEIKLSKKINDCTASIDRVDSSKSYSTSNCQWVDRRINYMKQSYSEWAFKRLCHLITSPATGKPIGVVALENIENRTGYKNITGSVWSEITNTPKEFSISIQRCWEIFVEQGGRCALTGIPLSLPTKHKELRRRRASLDRIDSKFGYIEGNVQWVLPVVNFMKQELPQEEFIHLCRQVARHNVKKDS